MTDLNDHPSSQFTRIIYIGDSGTGKTGSLVSLVKAGYKLRILDLDNGLDSLKAWIKKEIPEGIPKGQVDYNTVRDNYIMTTQGPIIDPSQKTKAFVESMKLMTTWSDGSKPSEWGPEYVFVCDSGTGLGKQAFEFARGLNPASKDPRQWFYAAQQAFESFIMAITSDDFKCNVIFISHITYKELQDGTTKGWPSAIGTALGSAIPKYFNTMVLAETVGFGASAKRKIKTLPTGMIDLKNPAPFAVAGELDLGTGLGTLFKTLKEN